MFLVKFACHVHRKCFAKLWRKKVHRCITERRRREYSFLKKKVSIIILCFGIAFAYFAFCCFTCVNGCVAFCHGCTSPCLYHILFLKDVLPFQTVLFFRHWRLSILYMYGRKVLSQKIKIKKLVYTCLDFVGKVSFQPKNTFQEKWTTKNHYNDHYN